MNPYHDYEVSEGEWIRMFPCGVECDEMVWHRDCHEREIEVLHGKGWSFQRDNELPFIINTHSKFKINAMVYHRLITGDSALIIRIRETESV